MQHPRQQRAATLAAAVVDPKTLKQQQNLSDAELGQVIERAANLQRQAGEDRALAIDVVAVAGELDLEEKYVQAALTELEASRKLQAQAKLHAATLRRRLKLGALALLGVSAIGSLVVARSTGHQIEAAAQELQAAETRLQGALARQANLIPQLVALSGGDPKTLLQEARVVIQAPTAQERLAAADVFAASLSRALANMPATAAPDQRNLNLQHEVAGAQNRITTERSRYEAALSRKQTAEQRPLASLARVLGWAGAS